MVHTGKRPRKHKKLIDLEEVDKLIDQGCNCKQIAKAIGIAQNIFGMRFNELFGIYPSVYIAKKKGKYGNRCAKNNNA